MLDGNQDYNQSSAYETLMELLPAYKLGITDPDETALVERLLQQYPEAKSEADEYETLTEDLLMSSPQVEPPPHLIFSLMREVSETPDVVILQPNEVFFSMRERILLLGTVAMFILLFGFNLYTLLTISDLQNENDVLGQQITSQERMMVNFAQDNYARFQLTSDRADNRMNGWVMCNPDEHVGLVRVENFPEPEMVYQIWLWKDGQKIDVGVISIQNDGSGVLVLYAPHSFKNYEYIGITMVGDDDDEAEETVLQGRLY